MEIITLMICWKRERERERERNDLVYPSVADMQVHLVRGEQGVYAPFTEREKMLKIKRGLSCSSLIITGASPLSLGSSRTHDVDNETPKGELKERPVSSST